MDHGHGRSRSGVGASMSRSCLLCVCRERSRSVRSVDACRRASPGRGAGDGGSSSAPRTAGGPLGSVRPLSTTPNLVRPSRLRSCAFTFVLKPTAPQNGAHHTVFCDCVLSTVRMCFAVLLPPLDHGPAVCVSRLSRLGIPYRRAKSEAKSQMRLSSVFSVRSPRLRDKK